MRHHSALHHMQKNEIIYNKKCGSAVNKEHISALAYGLYGTPRILFLVDFRGSMSVLSSSLMFCAEFCCFPSVKCAGSLLSVVNVVCLMCDDDMWLKSFSPHHVPGGSGHGVCKEHV